MVEAWGGHQWWRIEVSTIGVNLSAFYDLLAKVSVNPANNGKAGIPALPSTYAVLM
ncbi:hypothetical protein EMIT0P201_40244 [Pseudomonas chlororaphis]